MDDQLLSVREAAAQLSLSVEAVRRRIARGVLPATRVGRDWLIRQSDVDVQGKPWARQ